MQRFRSSFARFAFVNAVIVIAAIFTSSDFISITVIWGIFMALKYSKLWSAGYDWHDVFREPRDRPFTDVLQEAGEHIEDFFNKFDKKKRGKVREGRRRRRLAAPPQRPVLPPGSASAPARPADYGRYADYPPFFVYTAAIGLPSLVLVLWLIRRDARDRKEAAAA